MMSFTNTSYFRDGLLISFIGTSCSGVMDYLLTFKLLLPGCFFALLGGGGGMDSVIRCEKAGS